MHLELNIQACQYLKVLRWYASACVCFHLSLQYGIAWGKGSNCVTRGGVRLWRSFVAQGGQMCSVRGKRSWWLLCPRRSNWEMDAQVYITLLFQQLLTKLLRRIISGACFYSLNLNHFSFCEKSIASWIWTFLHKPLCARGCLHGARGLDERVRVMCSSTQQPQTETSLL